MREHHHSEEKRQRADEHDESEMRRIVGIGDVSQIGIDDGRRRGQFEDLVGNDETYDHERSEDAHDDLLRDVDPIAERPQHLDRPAHRKDDDKKIETQDMNVNLQQEERDQHQHVHDPRDQSFYHTIITRRALPVYLIRPNLLSRAAYEANAASRSRLEKSGNNLSEK